MTKYLKLPMSVSAWEEDPSVITLDLSETPVAEFTLCLVLLEKGLADRVLIDGSGGSKVDLKVNPNQKARAIGSWNTSKLRLQLTLTELGYWLSFFISYYLEGAAPVGHIDVDVQDEAGGPAFTVTIEVALAVPPVSAEEARRRLGL